MTWHQAFHLQQQGNRNTSQLFKMAVPRKMKTQIEHKQLIPKFICIYTLSLQEKKKNLLNKLSFVGVDVSCKVEV